MSRIIKFRAWGRYGDWDEAEDKRQFQMIDGDSLCFEEFKPVCDLLEDKEDEEYFMQYTGLKDKNGVDAYEKDYDEDGNMIDWCENCCGYQFFQIDIPSGDVIFCHNCEGNFMVQDHIDDFKIIGNIYETKR